MESVLQVLIEGFRVSNSIIALLRVGEFAEEATHSPLLSQTAHFHCSQLEVRP